MKKTTASSNTHGIGRRKSSVARVWLTKGDGSISINGKSFDEYFHTAETKEMVTLPFRVLAMNKDFSVDVNVYGGGIVSQAGAVKLGLSRALVNFDEKFKAMLKKHKLLSVDSRVKERKKYGQKAARRKFQFVKR